MTSWTHLENVSLVIKISYCEHLTRLTTCNQNWGKWVHGRILDESIFLTVGRPASYDAGIRGEATRRLPPEPLISAERWILSDNWCNFWLLTSRLSERPYRLLVNESVVAIHSDSKLWAIAAIKEDPLGGFPQTLSLWCYVNWMGLE